MTINRTIDGVPVVYAERPGATTVNLMFRVGQADETLPVRGVTHLIEHLALFPLGIRDHHSNGQTGTSITNFHATGDANDVVTFLSGVTEALTALPYARLDAERSVLRTEAAQRGPWVASDLAVWRYGAVSDGAVAYREFGLDRLTRDEIEQWRARYFTADNAILLVVGPEFPEGISLTLPSGERRPIEPVRSLLPPQRSVLSAGQGRVLFEALVERSTEATIVAQLLARLMYQYLRLDSAYSYTATCSYEPRDAEVAIITGFADALDEQTDVVVGAVVDLLAQVRLGAFDDELVEEIVASRLDDLNNPDYAKDYEVGTLGSSAFDLLVGAEPLTQDQYRDKLSAVTAQKIRERARTILDDVLLQVPAGYSADWGGFEPVPLWSTERVTPDRIHRALDESGSLHWAPDGVSTVSDANAVTVPFASCAVCLSWPDGRRVLIADDGMTITIEPTMYEDGQSIISAIDDVIEPEKIVPCPARDPDEIPQPPERPSPSRSGWFRRRKGSSG